MKQSNVLAIIVWVMGLLGCTGFIDPFGFYALLIPIIFWLFGNKLTKQHCKAYFNVLITGVIIHFLGVVVNLIFGIFNKQLNYTLIALVYFAIMSIFGLIAAIKNKRYKPVLSANIIK